MKTTRRVPAVGNLLFYFAVSLLVACCGKDEGEKAKPCAEKYGCVGAAAVEKPTGQALTLTFAGAPAGAQFVLMPYSLGEDTVDGGSSETFEFGFPTGTKTLQLTSAEASSHDEHEFRMLWNHFVAGAEQAPWFWQSVDRIDSRLALTKSTETVRATFENMKPSPNLKLATLAGCPTSSVPIPNFADSPVTVPAANFKAGTGYCVAYLSEPKTAGTRAEVESTIQTVLERYKSVIYKDTFAAVGGFEFDPVVVIVDVSSDLQWNVDDPTLQLSGVYVATVSKDQKRPYLYLASNFLEIESFKGRDAAELKRLWHGTLAHEMQHAITDYYRGKQAGQSQTVGVDEGVAHFMEDVFGYGGENFKSYAGVALTAFADGGTFLKGSAAEKQDLAQSRGFAQTLIYYLQSRKGGTKFTDGVVSGGDGLQWVTKLIKDKDSAGAKSLAKHFEDNWFQAVGDYLAALVLDNQGLSDPERSEHSVQKPETGIKDLTGGTDKTFGMRFNGAGQPKREYETLASVDGAIELTYYATVPLIYETKTGNAELKVDCPDIKNSGVVVVRIK